MDPRPAIGVETTAITYYSRGLAYRKLGQTQRAIQDCGKAIQLDSNYAEAYNNRGIAYANLDQYQRAIEDYDQAIRPYCVLGGDGGASNAPRTKLFRQA